MNLPVIISGLFTALVGAYAAFMTFRSTRDTNKASKVPTVEAIWARQEEDTRARRRAESNLQTLLYVFLNYTARAEAGGSPDLTDEERRTIEAVRGVLE